MSWAEFLIRLFAYKRQELKEWEKVRFISYSATKAPHLDPKKLPKTIEKFLPLGGKKEVTKVDEGMKQRFLEATRKYLLAKQNG
jgi:hypothetical protein